MTEKKKAYGTLEVLPAKTDNTEKQTDPIDIDKPVQQIYLHLQAVLEADITTGPNKVEKAFLLAFVDISGQEFMCPVTVLPNYMESTRVCLQRLTPVKFNFKKPEDVKSEVKKVAEIVPDTSEPYSVH